LSVEDAKSRLYLEWQTRALATFIAATAMSSDGSKELQRAAMNLSIIPEEPEETTSPSVIEPLPGSFEKLMGIFPTRQ
jgi:hypothetical protein